MTAVSVPSKDNPDAETSGPFVIRGFEVSVAGFLPGGSPGDGVAGPYVRAVIARAPMHSPTREYQQAVCRDFVNEILCHEPFSSAARANRPWILTKTPLGVPVLTGGRDAGNYGVSMSHSGPWAMVAVAKDARVGVDIERGRANMNLAGMAAYMGWGQGAANRDGFLARWTLWEACVKQEGSTIFKQSSVAFEALNDRGTSGGIASADGWAAVRGRVSASVYFALVLNQPSRQSLQLREIHEDFAPADRAGGSGC